MIFVSATLLMILFAAIVLPSVVCGRKGEAAVVSSEKTTEVEEVEREEEVEEEPEDSEETEE